MMLLGVLHAAGDPVEALLEKISAQQQKIRTAEFRYRQTIRLKITGEEQQAEGRGAWARPSRFCVEQTRPRPTLTVGDGRTVYHYEPELRQVAIGDLSELSARAQLPLSLSGDAVNPAELRKRYRLRLDPADAAGATLLLVPLKGPEMEMAVTFSTASWLPLSFRMDTRTLEVRTRILDWKTDGEIPPGRFSFEIPKDAAILRFSDLK